MLTGGFANVSRLFFVDKIAAISQIFKKRTNSGKQVIDPVPERFKYCPQLGLEPSIENMRRF